MTKKKNYKFKDEILGAERGGTYTEVPEDFQSALDKKSKADIRKFSVYTKNRVCSMDRRS